MSWREKYEPRNKAGKFSFAKRATRTNRARYIMQHTARKTASLYDAEAWLTYNGAQAINLVCKLNYSAAMRYHNMHRKPLLP